MPKKHAPPYTQTKPSNSYVHPSLQSSRPSTSASPTPQTVNQRIQQLRREQTPRATSERRDEVTELVRNRSVPPQLRQILQIPEVNAPLPKAGVRARPVPRARRPPPGPAAPSSWLSHSRHTPAHARNRRLVEEGGSERLYEQFCALARLNDVEYRRLPPRPSLVHACLRTFATHWEHLIEYEQHYLAALPTPLKEAMLSYLSLYGIQGCLDMKSFKVLFLTDRDVIGGTGSDDIRFLDLTGLLHQNYTLSDLNRSLAPSISGTTLTKAMGGLSVSPSNSNRKALVSVADSWEDEADEASTPPFPSTLSVPIFPNLTRLSLAHPGSNASWTDLLNISTKLNTLTHLSLAYWPTPSTTPNAATASMVSKHAKPVALGGSHIYSELDDDWHEAANILRRLSLNTYCLKWLDLEGCTWHKALTWSLPDEDDRPTGIRPNGKDKWPRWVEAHSGPGPDWCDAWQQISYLNLSQGWIPKDQHAIMTMPAGMLPVELLGWLREHEHDEKVSAMLRDAGRLETEMWVEREKAVRIVRGKILGERKRYGGSWCKVDYGWDLGHHEWDRRGWSED
ncbi:uncharacterized protein BDR25DRAFT_242988 [Lindgomyces ingoldianus]|uniref:Uncharacterized protein n=1 Tax=Lindgomyces ingoldianus TaxID=673940 RepID=A0ACB6QDY6_9PLEO|nr:uncharacterized protein BDR25DRAFT_242988 [Lindgomyces ingoldianus]KAF2464361.1 hypothetical protein BDR25DRAFT_242988 [Lindgomyces ingoldianus]